MLGTTPSYQIPHFTAECNENIRVKIFLLKVMAKKLENNKMLQTLWKVKPSHILFNLRAAELSPFQRAG